MTPTEAGDSTPHAEDEAEQAPLDPALLLRFYRVMATARACDERMWILNRQGRANFIVTGRGHEAAQAGCAAALRAGHDYALLYYRSMTVALMLGVTPDDLLRSTLSRAADPFSGGRQLSNHYSSRELRIPTVSSVVAGNISHAVGCAYAAKVRGADWIAASFFGEGATAKGDFHESLNFAAIHRLPVVFVCENNGWAISVPVRLESSTQSIAERAAAYGMPGHLVDGLDPVVCYQAMSEAVARARDGDGPTLIEATCIRLVPHSSDDDDRYRSDEERAALRARDPLPAFRRRLIAWGVAAEFQLDTLDEEVRGAARAAEDAALALPLAGDAFSHLTASQGVDAP
jgi:2-oxoisovalerate dehydrogenase E1 component alpha subunit